PDPGVGGNRESTAPGRHEPLDGDPAEFEMQPTLQRDPPVAIVPAADPTPLPAPLPLASPPSPLPRPEPPTAPPAVPSSDPARAASMLVSAPELEIPTVPTAALPPNGGDGADTAGGPPSVLPPADATVGPTADAPGRATFATIARLAALVVLLAGFAIGGFVGYMALFA